MGSFFSTLTNMFGGANVSITNAQRGNRSTIGCCSKTNINEIDNSSSSSMSFDQEFHANKLKELMQEIQEKTEHIRNINQQISQSVAELNQNKYKIRQNINDLPGRTKMESNI